MHARWTTAAGLACLATSVLVGFGAGGGTAAAAEAKDVLDLVALTGPRGGDVTITVPAAAGGGDVEKLQQVHVRLFDANDADGEPNRIVNVEDVDAEDGVANVKLGRVARGTRVEVQAQFRDPSPPRTVLLRGRATAKLRPDLVITAVRAPAQTLTTTPVDVVADVEELNGDTGAEAKLTLMLGPTPVADAETVTIGAGGSKSVTFDAVKLEQATTAELTVRVEDADPFETNTGNNTRLRTIDVTQHELARSNVLVESLRGYGAQFNNHVYAPITPWPADLPRTDFETKVKELEPHLVRIFYNDNWDGNRDGRFPNWPENYASFVKAVRLAQEAGAIVDVSFQNLGNARSTPIPDMKKFADVLEDLVRNHGLTNVRWAEVGNEPNSGGTTAVSLAEYETLVRTLDGELRNRGLRDEIALMGPGLVENAGVPTRTHYVWMQWIAANMGDVLDAWGQHVYWFYNDTGRLEYRLRDIWHLLNEVIPPEQRKPVYMMEYGVRGLAACPGKTNRANTYYAGDPTCPDIWRTNIAGFQQLWFAVASAQLGYVGALKWDAYWGVYDFTLNPPQVYWTIGPAAEGSPLLPSYHALSLLFHTTEPGWQVVGVAPWDESDWTVPTHGIEGHASNDTPEQELAAYAGPNGELTILGLDTRGGSLNGVSSEAPSQYSIGDLPANTSLKLVVWNATGDGTYSLAATVSTNDAGVARFEVPLHAAFALTTVPIS